MTDEIGRFPEEQDEEPLLPDNRDAGTEIKNAKGGANDLPKDLVLIKIRLSAYNETFGKKEAEIIVWR